MRNFIRFVPLLMIAGFLFSCEPLEDFEKAKLTPAMVRSMDGETALKMARTYRSRTDAASKDKQAMFVYHPDELVRMNAITGLGYYDSPAIREAVVFALQDNSGFIRQMAVSSAGLLKIKEAAGRIEKALSGEGGDVTGAALMALGRMGANEALPEMLKLLSHEDYNLRCYALKGISLLDAPEAIEPVERLLAEEENPDVKALARCALYALGEKRHRDAVLKAAREGALHVELWCARILASKGEKAGLEKMLALLENESMFRATAIMLRELYPSMPPFFLEKEKNKGEGAKKIREWVAENVTNVEGGEKE